MNWHDLFLSIVAFFSEILGTLSGFGSSTFFVPIGVLFEKSKFIIVLTSFLHVFGNASKLFFFRKNFDLNLFLKFTLPSVILAGAGAFFNDYIDFDKLKLALGIFIMVLALFLLFQQKIIGQVTARYAVFIVGISGFITGLLGTGGAIRGIALTSIQLEKNIFVALSAGIDIGGDLLRAAIYIYNGYFDWSHWFFIPLLALASYSGTYFGKFLLSMIDQKQFEKVVLFFVFLSGLVLIF